MSVYKRFKRKRINHGAKDVEKELHRKFENFALGNEWFVFTDDELNKVYAAFDWYRLPKLYYI